jgi:hypothetical protein
MQAVERTGCRHTVLGATRWVTVQEGMTWESTEDREHWEATVRGWALAVKKPTLRARMRKTERHDMYQISHQEGVPLVNKLH